MVARTRASMLRSFVCVCVCVCVCQDAGCEPRCIVAAVRIGRFVSAETDVSVKWNCALRNGKAESEQRTAVCTTSRPLSVLYCTELYCTVLFCTVLYCTVLYCTVLYCTLLYCIVLNCTVLYLTVLYLTVLYLLYCTLLYCTVLY